MFSTPPPLPLPVSFIPWQIEASTERACWENQIGQAVFSLMVTTTLVEWASSAYLDPLMHAAPALPIIGPHLQRLGLHGKNAFDLKKHMVELMYGLAVHWGYRERFVLR